MKGRTSEEQVSAGAGGGSPWVAPVVFVLAMVLGLGLLALFGRLESGLHPPVVRLSLGDYPEESVTYVDLSREGLRMYRSYMVQKDALGVGTRHWSGAGFYLVRHDGKLQAFLARSTHMGGSVKWIPEREVFYDTVHGSEWFRNGSKLRGPAYRDLDWFPVSVDGGEVRVDVRTVYCGYRHPTGTGWQTRGYPNSDCKEQH